MNHEYHILWYAHTTYYYLVLFCHNAIINTLAMLDI